MKVRIAAFIMTVVHLGCTTSDKPVLNTPQNPWLIKPATDHDLKQSAIDGADYLMRIQAKNGVFTYIQDPFGNCCKKKPTYSLVRHLGAIYSVLKTYDVNPDERLIYSAINALKFSSRFVQLKDPKSIIRDLRQKPSLAAPGFFLMNLSYYYNLTGDFKYNPLATRMAEFIIDNLKFDGPFRTRHGWAESQAIIGLAHYYLYVKERSIIPKVTEQYLNAMVKANMRSHWSIQAIEWQSRMKRVSPSMLKFAFDSAHSLLNNVWDSKGQKNSTGVGSKGGRLYSSRAASRNEGLIAAYQLAKHYKVDNQANFFKRRIKEHLAFALQFQYGGKGSLLNQKTNHGRIAKVFDLHGGVFNHPEEGYVRIDYVSHHVRSLLSFLDAENSFAAP